jgi:predicted GNAT family acetyltransferase
MKPEFEELTLVKDEAKKRFYIEVDGHLAFINYDYAEGEHQIALVHTEAEPELLGTGVQLPVVEKTLQYIKENGKNYFPSVLIFLHTSKKHPEWKAIVDETFCSYDQL